VAFQTWAYELAWSVAAGGTRVVEAALRKRYERLKERLRHLAREEGLLPKG
jgi:hypothetical protein